MTLLAAALLLVSPSTQEPGSAQAIYKKSLPSIVTLKVKDRDGGGGTGTAFLAIREGLAVTAWHVVDSAQSVTARFADGQEFDVSGLVDKDEKRDVAIIRIKVAGRPLLPLASKEPEVGSKAFVIGAPRELDFTISDGIVSQLRLDLGLKVIQYTCPISPGNSGGPLLNEQGEVTGIVSYEREGQNLNFAIPITIARGLDSSLATVPWESVKNKGEGLFKSTGPTAAREADTAARIFAIRVEANKLREAMYDFRREISTVRPKNLRIPASFGVAAEKLPRLARELASLAPADEKVKRACLETGLYFLQLSESFDDLASIAREAMRKGAWDRSLLAELERETATFDAPPSTWQGMEEYFQKQIPASELEKYNPEIRALLFSGGKPPFPTITKFGVRFELRSLPTVVLTYVPKQSQAERSGLKAGDTIEMADGTPVVGLSDLETALLDHTGKKLRLTVKRLNGNRVTVTVEPK
ncbi:MAG: trypsin-like peptidase domain-containing protein [Fimbriimonas sp.]